MIHLRKSINIKICILYLMLAIINMSIFTIIIYENQVGLIVKNTKNEIIILTNAIVTSIDKLGNDVNSRNKKTVTREKLINEITGLISNTTNSFCIFTESGKLIYRSSENFQINQNDIIYGTKAVTNLDFTGKRFYSAIDRVKYEISFYIPFSMYTLEQSILFLKFKMNDINAELKQLYKLIIIIIILISVFHLLFAVLLFRLFVKPVKYLHDRSLEISKGDLTVRSDIHQEDEIGELSEAFNSMAQSVEEKVTELDAQYKLIQKELDLAQKVQDIIFPKVISNNRFNFSVYCKPVEKVSGDYYDIFDLGDSTYGFLIVDVQGHGIPAAMITMIIKEKFRLNAPEHNDPSELIKIINSDIYNILQDMDNALFFTAFYLIIDGDNNIYASNAGHTSPFIIRKSRKKMDVLKIGGMPIGVTDDMNELYKTHKTKGECGDKIILYTDGIPEARNDDKEEYGIDGMIKTIRKDFQEPADELLKALLRDLGGFTNLEHLKDDATLFVIELK